RIRIFDCELIQQSHIAELTDLAEVSGRHYRITKRMRPDIAGSLKIEVERHLAPTDQDASVCDSICKPGHLISRRRVSGAAGHGRSITKGRWRRRKSEADGGLDDRRKAGRSG